MNSGPKCRPTDQNQLTPKKNIKVRKRSAHDDVVMRRIEGGRMLKAGAEPAEVALKVGVSPTTVSAWKAILDAGGGLTALRRMSRGGRPPRLSDDQVLWLTWEVTLRTPEDHHIDPTKWGLPGKRWTAALICKLIKQKFSVDLGEGQVRRLVGPLRD